MKLCIDCKRFQKETGPLRYQDKTVWVPFSLPNLCVTFVTSPINGEPQLDACRPASDCRSDPDACGPKAKWFDPATLDGRLAMLYPDEDETNPETSSTVPPFSSTPPENDMSKSGILDAGNPSYAANCAHSARTAKAGAYDGGKPPSGPKPEPVRINGVPKVGGKGVAGK